MSPTENLPRRRPTLGALLSLAALSCASSPRPIEEAIAQSPPGMLTVVEFVDYRCTFCQQLHDVLWPLLEQQQGSVRVVIKHVPLDKHPGARRAAEVAVCAEEQGKLPAVHDALMHGAARTDEDTLDLAQHSGLDVEKFKECLRSDRPAARIADDTEAWEAVGADGLPLVFIQRKKFVGLVDIAPLEQALRDAR